jgi:1-acyl-sn-glycerol-3-phosphate acyltransferase
VYVKRTRRNAAKDQAVALARSLGGHQPVVVFPEGTTGPGTHLLPFRSTLLEAANFASRDVAIRPVAVDYHENRASVGWYDEDARENIVRLLGRRGTLRVTVHLLAPLDRSDNRKQLTSKARSAIAETLGLTSLDHSPIDGQE